MDFRISNDTSTWVWADGGARALWKIIRSVTLLQDRHAWHDAREYMRRRAR